jgi:hypothetical protein
MAMRRTLGSLLLTTALASSMLSGCGSEGGTDKQAADTGGADAGSPGGAVDFTQVAIVSATAAGGRPSQRATVLDDAAAVGAFSEQFRSPAMEQQLLEAVRGANVAEGRTLVGAVVALGCDVPPGVTVHRTGVGLAIKPRPVPSPLPECLAPVTSVALVAVDSDVV